MVEIVDKAMEVYLKIRWDKIQSVASLVALSGIALTGFNFWNWAWTVFFEPAGFNRDGNLPAIIGVVLVAFGLLTLVADKFATRITPPTFEQDRLIYNQSMNICRWAEVDSFLNDINSRYYRNGHKNSMVDMLGFLQQGEYKFTNAKMASASEELIKAGRDFSENLGSNFTGPDHPNSDIIKWHYDKNTQPGEASYEDVRTASQRLDALSRNFETAYKSYQSVANSLGLVDIR